MENKAREDKCLSYDRIDEADENATSRGEFVDALLAFVDEEDIDDICREYGYEPEKKTPIRQDMKTALEVCVPDNDFDSILFVPYEHLEKYSKRELIHELMRCLCIMQETEVLSPALFNEEEE